jgi:disulfide bond formation protein DsbB
MTGDRMARNLAGLLLLGGLVVIGTAWGFQLIGGYVPCKLCLEQRIPFYVGLPLTALALILLAVAAVFAYGSGLGVYQSGAEWQFWAGPSDCGGGTSTPTSAANMLQALQTTRVVSCTEASWRMLGLSFAGWNAVASGGLALCALAAAFLLNRRANPASVDA